MWQMNLGSDGDRSYPERPGEPDCSYYIRTGLCRFGLTCRFNHPRDRKLVLFVFLSRLPCCDSLCFFFFWLKVCSLKGLGDGKTINLHVQFLGYSNSKD